MPKLTKKQKEALEADVQEFAGMDVIAYLTDLFLFDTVLKNDGHVELTEEDAEAVNEIRKTRVVEFSSVITDEGKKKVTARFIYMGEEKKDEEDSDDN